jgi:hypothetical protein
LPRFTELLAQEAGQLSPELHLQLQQYAQDLAQRYGLA